jgi:hypothetical protein
LAHFIGPGRPLEVEEGGKISVLLGHLIIICNIVNFWFLFWLFRNQFNFKMLTLKKIYIEKWIKQLSPKEQRCTLMLNMHFSTHFWGWPINYEQISHALFFSCVKLKPEPTKTVEMRAKPVWWENIWYLLMHISKKLTFRNLTAGIKSQNKNLPVSQFYI